MSRISTPNEWKEYCNAMKKDGCVRAQVEPGKKSLSLIIQFAHSYRVEKKLPACISGYVIN